MNKRSVTSFVLVWIAYAVTYVQHPVQTALTFDIWIAAIVINVLIAPATWAKRDTLYLETYFTSGSLWQSLAYVVMAYGTVAMGYGIAQIAAMCVIYHTCEMIYIYMQFKDKCYALDTATEYKSSVEAMADVSTDPVKKKTA